MDDTQIDYSLKTGHSVINTRSFKRLNIDSLLCDLYKVPWHIIEMADTIEESWQIWKSLFLQVVNDHAPMKSHCVKRKGQTIYNEEVAALRRVRDEYHEEAIKTGSASTWAV